MLIAQNLRTAVDCFASSLAIRNRKRKLLDIKFKLQSNYFWVSLFFVLLLFFFFSFGCATFTMYFKPFFPWKRTFILKFTSNRKYFFVRLSWERSSWVVLRLTYQIQWSAVSLLGQRCLWSSVKWNLFLDSKFPRILARLPQLRYAQIRVSTCHHYFFLPINSKFLQCGCYDSLIYRLVFPLVSKLPG